MKATLDTTLSPKRRRIGKLALALKGEQVEDEPKVVIFEAMEKGPSFTYPIMGTQIGALLPGASMSREANVAKSGVVAKMVLAEAAKASKDLKAQVIAAIGQEPNPAHYATFGEYMQVYATWKGQYQKMMLNAKVSE